MFIGVAGLAQAVFAAYVGDSEGKARLFYRADEQPSGPITPGNMTSLTAPAPYACSAKATFNSGDYAAYHGFNYDDKDVATPHNYLSNGVPKDGEWWIQVDLGEAKRADKGRIRCSHNVTGHGWASNFKILGSNDSTAWNDSATSNKWGILANVTDYARPSTPFTWAEYVGLSPGKYRYYRFSITYSSLAGHMLTFCQFELSAK